MNEARNASAGGQSASAVLADLTGLLPPAPPAAEFSGRAERKAELLAAITGPRPAGARQRPAARPAARRMLMPAASAAAVLIVATLAVAVPHLVGHAGAGPAAQGQHGQQGQHGPAAASTLTSARHWTVPAGGIRAITVTDTAGEVVITGSRSPGPAAITATPSYQHAAPRLSYQIAGGTLAVIATCPNVQQNCSVALGLRVPAGVPVSAHTDQGDVQVTGFSARVRASADQGKVTLSRISGAVTAGSQQGSIALRSITGSVTAQTAQGSITGQGLRVSTARFGTDEGSVQVSFAAAPDAVTATSQVGQVTLTVPGSASYRVSASSQLGTTSVRVPQSASSAHRITASSQVGSVTVRD